MCCRCDRMEFGVAAPTKKHSHLDPGSPIRGKASTDVNSNHNWKSRLVTLKLKTNV